ncbi:MAG: uracil-DNA glycosylase family protein, partial [Giesbergeria sp.]
MTLALDARQRAMLLEMGVRVWSPPHGPAAARVVAAAPESAPAKRKPVQAPDPAQRPPSAAHAPTVAAAGAQARTGAAGQRWQVQAPRLLYPDADTALTPPELGAGWLLVTEAIAPDDPQADKSERLLTAMLHALQLHRHPRVALCSVAPEHGAGAHVDGADAGAAIARHVEAFAPSVVLVMGRGAVLAALARSDPLGKLRGTELAIAGVPVVVTFSPLLLLRNPQSKPTAWADLC